jgi:hypothetical protein
MEQAKQSEPLSLVTTLCVVTLPGRSAASSRPRLPNEEDADGERPQWGDHGELRHEGRESKDARGTALSAGHRPPSNDGEECKNDV